MTVISINFRKIVVAAAAMTLSAGSFSQPPTAEAADAYSLIFNCDGCSCSISQFPPPITLGQLRRPVDELEGTQVDVFIHCVNLGGDVYNYPSRVGELFGQSITDWSKVHPRLKNQAANLKSLADRGIDPVAVLEKRTGELGMKFWLSMRMNDQHEDDVRRFGAKITPFKKQNRHLLIGPDYPPGCMAYADKYGFSYTWNYAQEQTREHLLAVIEEMLDRYAIDGLELDFDRAPCFFKKGEEDAGKAIMTEFIRTVGERVKKTSQAKSRPITLAARVPANFRRCEELGLDVRRWIEEELVDVLVPMDPGYLDMQPELSEFVAAAKGRKVAVAGGFDPATNGYGQNVAQLYAAVSVIRAQGAESVYLFNFDCHRQRGKDNPYTEDEKIFLRNAANPEFVAQQGKHYFITRGWKPGEMQLPDELHSGRAKEYHLYIGDDMDAVGRTGKPASTLLRITLAGFDPHTQKIEIQINGQTMEKDSSASKKGVFSLQNPPMRAGDNTIALGLAGGESTKNEAVRVEKIEYYIK